MSEVAFETTTILYDLQIHPSRASTIYITNKMTRELSYIKLRHDLDDKYAIDLVDPETFKSCAESHSISTTERSRSILLHNKQAVEEIPFTNTSSRIGFQWSFDWEGDQYRWIRPNRLRNSLECRRVSSQSGDVCAAVAQYTPSNKEKHSLGVLAMMIHAMMPHGHRSPLECMIHMTLFIVLDKKLSDMNGGMITSKMPWCSLRKYRHNYLSSQEDNQDKEYPKIASNDKVDNDEQLSDKESNTISAPTSWNIHQMKIIDATATLRLHSNHHETTHQHKLEDLFSSHDHRAPSSSQHQQISLPLSLSSSRYQQTADERSYDNSQFALQRPISLRRVSADTYHPSHQFQQRDPYAYYPYFAYFTPSSMLTPAASQYYNAYYYYGYH